MSQLSADRVGRVEVCLAAAVVLWAFNFSATKYALTHGFAPLAYSSARFGLAGLVFGGAAVVRERSVRIGRRDLRLLAAVAIVGVWLNQLCVVYSFRLVGAATVALASGGAPALVALVGHLARSERIGRRHAAAVLTSFAGVALVATGGRGGFSSTWCGVLLVLGSIVTWSLAAAALGPLSGRYSPLRVSAAATLAGSLPLTATAALQLWRQDWSAVRPLAWCAFLYSLLLGYVVANVAWIAAVRSTGVARAALYTTLQPFLGATFALAALAERLGYVQVVGGAIIGAAIVGSRPAGHSARDP